MSDATSLYAVAHELLVASAAILTTTPAGAPTYQYVAHGDPAYDCPDSLIVHVGMLQYEGLSAGNPVGGMRAPQVGVVPVVPLTVTVLRCVSRQALPSGGAAIRNADLDAIQTDAQAVYADGWALFNGLWHRYRTKQVFDGYPCRLSEVAGALPIAPDGGCLGWAVMTSVELDGYAP